MKRNLLLCKVGGEFCPFPTREFQVLKVTERFPHQNQSFESQCNLSVFFSNLVDGHEIADGVVDHHQIAIGGRVYSANVTVSGWNKMKRTVHYMAEEMSLCSQSQIAAECLGIRRSNFAC